MQKFNFLPNCRIDFGPALLEKVPNFINIMFYKTSNAQIMV